MFKRLKGLKRVTPGEWQAGPPRRSDGCGLGVAFACAVERSEKLLQSILRVLSILRFKGWQTAGLDAHKKQLMWPWGCLLAAGLGMPRGCLSV